MNISVWATCCSVAEKKLSPEEFQLDLQKEDQKK